MKNLLSERCIQPEVTDEAKKLLAKEGFNPVYGARPLKRVIQSQLQDSLAEKIINGTIQEGDTVVAEAAGDELIITSPIADTVMGCDGARPSIGSPVQSVQSSQSIQEVQPVYEVQEVSGLSPLGDNQSTSDECHKISN